MKNQHFAGVLGWPLRYTLSPVIHNAAFRRLGLDWVYLAWPVHPSDLTAAVAGLRALGASGANVTMPHKEEVMGLLDDVSPDADSTGAVNTIQRTTDGLVGHNTDVEGFCEFLAADAGVDVAGASALVVGAGGAARSIVRALGGLGASEIVVAARSEERAARLAGLEGAAVFTAVALDKAAAHSSSATVIVNATPVGTDGRDPLPEADFRAGQVVIDLTYAPPATPLVRRARAAGASAWGGLGMLVHQAAASFRIWTGQQPPIEAMSAAALHALASTGHRKEH
jgi:shikimate dehydrogenase